MRVLGVDLGEKRIGLALSDELAILASPLEVFEFRDRPAALQHIAEVVKRRQVGEIVVGLPLDMRGSRGVMAEAAEAFADELREALGLPVVCWDERLTTAQAERAMIEADTSRAGRRRQIDMVAAALMLQAYLDLRRNQEAASQ